MKYIVIIVILPIIILAYFVFFQPFAILYNDEKLEINYVLNYTIQLTKVLNAHYDEHGKFPSNLPKSNLGEEAFWKYTCRVEGQGIGSEYTITATLKSQREMVKNKTLLFWTTDGGKKWECRSGGDNPIDRRLLASTPCKDNSE
ncbi:MAG: pilin [Magnetococcales bacterium]|nr:pilin [Magnetococcales bacterium]